MSGRRVHHGLFVITSFVAGACAVYENDLLHQSGARETPSAGSSAGGAATPTGGKSTAASTTEKDGTPVADGGAPAGQAGAASSSVAGAGAEAGGSAVDAAGAGGATMSSEGGNESGGSTDGGTAGAAGEPNDGTCATTVVGSGLLGSIDDFDDGDAQLLALDGRKGAWSFVTDASGSTTPPPGAPLPVAGGVSGKALHLQGTGLRALGAVLSGALVASGDCYDASAYRGVNITLKGSGEVWLVVHVAAIDGRPTAERDYHRVKLALSAAWTTYTLPWSQLTQSGRPGLPPIELDPKTLTVIEVVPTSEASPLSFDLWLDNVAFRKKA